MLDRTCVDNHAATAGVAIRGPGSRKVESTLVTDDRVDGAREGWLNGLYRWFKGPDAPPRPEQDPGGYESAPVPSRIGRYAIRRTFAVGGRGVVYEACDERLDRSVALKMMLALEHDDTARKRFWREARAAASINHPNVCQIYEVGEADAQGADGVAVFPADDGEAAPSHAIKPAKPLQICC